MVFQPSLDLEKKGALWGLQGFHPGEHRVVIPSVLPPPSCNCLAGEAVFSNPGRGTRVMT